MSTTVSKADARRRIERDPTRPGYIRPLPMPLGGYRPGPFNSEMPPPEWRPDEEIVVDPAFDDAHWRTGQPTDTQ